MADAGDFPSDLIWLPPKTDKSADIPDDVVWHLPSSSASNIKAQVRQEWLNAGYSPAAVDGIMRRIGIESDWNPRALGDGDTSFGLYQHHDDRAVRLAQWSREHNLNPDDPIAQTRFAIAEMGGLDQRAAAARPALMKATDPTEAYTLFTNAFERPAVGAGGGRVSTYPTGPLFVGSSELPDIVSRPQGAPGAPSGDIVTAPSTTAAPAPQYRPISVGHGMHVPHGHVSVPHAPSLREAVQRAVASILARGRR